MVGPILYRVLDEHPYLGRDEEHACLTLEAAATLAEDLTGEHASQIIADVEEDPSVLPWKWEDDETGREVTLRLEVE